MNTRDPVAFHVRSAIGFLPRLQRFAQLAMLLLAGMISAQPAAASDAAANVTLSPLTPESASVNARAGDPVELAVSKKVGGNGVSGQAVDWTISGPDSASVTPTSSMTSQKNETDDAGIARTVFTAGRSGNYVVVATTQDNPGCSGKDCATYIDTKFTIHVTGKVGGSDEPAEHHTLRDAAIATGMAAILLANKGGDNTLAPFRTLAINGGDNQSALRNSALPNPLQVVAKNNGFGVSGLVVNWSVSGGGTLSATTSTTNSFGVASVSVTNVGPGPGPVIVTATRADDPSSTVQFTENVLIPGLLKISGDFQSAPTNGPVPSPLVVEAQVNGSAQAGTSILWTVTSGDAVISSVSNGGVTDGAGLSSATVTFGPTEDTVVITATRADDPTVSQSFTLFATVTRTLGIVSGDNQTGAPNAPLPTPLTVLAQDNGANAAGITILWSANNGATLSAPSTVTGGTGQASVTITNMGSSLGPVIVTATRADDPTATVSFTENISPPTFSIVSGDAQSGLVGSAAAAPMVVHLVDGGGNPVAGQTITWTVISGSATVASFSSLTGPTGQASMTFNYGSFPGPITIQAGAYAGAVTVNFTETALAPGGVAKASGDAQTGAPGATLAPFVVQIPPTCACSLAGVPVTFTITSSIGGTLSVVSTVTDALGQASTTLTLGLTPGTVTVLAQVAGGPSTIFTATVSGVLVGTTLTVVSGDLQALTPNVASAPMVVLLKAGAVPLSGMTISWSTTGGTLSAGSAVTDVNGNASVTVTESTPATISVTASFAAVAQYTASSATFTQNSTIAALPALSTNQVAVGEALDAACADLQVAAVLTPEQQDLLNQCLAVTAAGTVSPAATEAAIDQMLPDVSETQNQTGQNAVTAQTTNISGRIQALRNGTYGSSMGGLALTAAGGTIPLSSFAATLLNEDEPAKSEQTFDRWGFFASGNIGRGDAKAKALTPSYNLDINGITAGVDYRKSDTLILGTAIGFTHQNTDLVGGEGSVHMHGLSLSGYATWYHGVNWYLDSVLTFGWDHYRHVRRIDYVLPIPGGGSVVVNQFAKASAGGDDRTATMTFGRDFHHQAWAFSVYGRGQYSVMNFDGFQERLDNSASGSGLALNVQSRSVTQLSSVLGGKIDYTHSTDWGVLLPHFELEWQHEYRGDPDNFVATFINDPTATPITVTGDAIDKSYFRLGVGLSVVMTHGRSGFVLYQRVVGQSGVSQENLSLGFRVEF